MHFATSTPASLLPPDCAAGAGGIGCLNLPTAALRDASAPVGLPSTVSHTEQTSSVMASGYSDTSDISVADFDGDGNLDLVIAYSAGSKRAVLFLGDGDGSFSAAGETGDLEGDDSETSASTSTATATAAGDFDGDGDMDLIIGSSGSANILLLNNGAGVFSAVNGSDLVSDANTDTVAIVAGDVDNDGDLDCFVGNGDTIELYLNSDGAGSFVKNTTWSGTSSGSGTYVMDLVLVDLDGDSSIDLVIATGNGAGNRILYGNGAGGFEDDAELTFTSKTGMNCLAAGDLDGDGDYDLVFGKSTSDGITLYFNDGAPSGDRAQTRLVFTSVDNKYGGTSDIQGFALGDIDGDSDLDVAIGSRAGGNMMYLNDGTGTFTLMSDWDIAGGGIFQATVVLADFNGVHAPAMLPSEQCLCPSCVHALSPHSTPLFLCNPTIHA